MKENLIYFAKLSASAVASFVKINILGSFTTVFVVVVEFVLMSKNINAGSSAHVSAIPFLTMMFAFRPIGSILCYITCLASSFLFFTLGNKYIISKLANKLITDKSESLINPLLDKVINKFQAKQPIAIKNVGDFSINKLKIIQDIQNDDSENKWLRKIVVFGMKKIKLDDIDFNQENQNFYDIIKLKTHQTLKNISEPSRKSIFILIGVQFAILLFVWLTNY